MLEEAPRIQRGDWIRPPAERVDALRGTPTGFVVDALGGAAALDYRIKPAIPGQDSFCGVALTCDAGPAAGLAGTQELESAFQFSYLVRSGTSAGATRAT